MQTPYLEWDEAEELLKKYYVKPDGDKPTLTSAPTGPEGSQPDKSPVEGALVRE